MPDPNLRLLEEAATKLAPFLQKIVFVGGVSLGLLITDKAAAPIRTTDVDVIAEIITYTDYIAFSERLREEHFTEDMSEEPLTCRWYHGKLKLDVLALSEEVLGYTNIWYEGALDNAVSFTLPGGQTIRLITAPYFLGTKMEAIQTTWQHGFPCKSRPGRFCSRDRRTKYRSTLLQEIADSPDDLRTYLTEAAKSLLDESRFLDALPGFVLDDARVPLILERVNQLAQIGRR